jgi:hypothetical protein
MEGASVKANTTRPLGSEVSGMPGLSMSISPLPQSIEDVVPSAGSIEFVLIVIIAGTQECDTRHRLM